MTTAYFKTGLTGGAAGDLDEVGHGDMAVGDIAYVGENRNFMFYLCEDTGDGEDNPWIIEPDDAGAGTLRWHLQTTGFEKQGGMIRPYFKWASDVNLTIGAGAYHLISKGWVHWDLALTYGWTYGAADTWYYLYIDTSAITKSGIITAAELTEKTTAPTYYTALGGFYDNNDRCIFASYSDADEDQTRFHHAGGRLVTWDDREEESTSAPGAAFGNYALNHIPDFDGYEWALERFYIDDTALSDIIYLPGGSTATTGREMVSCAANEEASCINTIAAPSRTIQLKYTNSEPANFDMSTHGWYLPQGM